MTDTSITHTGVTGQGLEGQLERMLRAHQPDMERQCWANQRFCQGCEERVHMLIGGFERHQAQVIAAMLKERLGV